VTLGNPAPPERIRDMFDRIAGVYDGMNLAISGFQEPRWRRRAVREAGLPPCDRVLDVACGTGKLTNDLHRAVQPGGEALGVDVSSRMIALARRGVPQNAGPRFEQGDALELPVESDSFDAATIAFGMRNLADYRRGFHEMARAVRPGGRVVCLEIARPTRRLGRLAARWFDHVVPFLGRIVGQGNAYAYLVDSTRGYPGPDRIAALMRDVGLEDVDWFGMSGGMVTIHVGSVPGPRARGTAGPRTRAPAPPDVGALGPGPRDQSGSAGPGPRAG
jgi:demethylmenaquinone methyltransferase/2-methoxy-6-polyprenyl-1,4-benzoquinol methylase